MGVVMFGAMCRYDDVIHLRWRNIKFDAGYQRFHIEFEKRKTISIDKGTASRWQLPRMGWCAPSSR